MGGMRSTVFSTLCTAAESNPFCPEQSNAQTEGGKYKYKNKFNVIKLNFVKG
jgi:hypothetical protein